MDPLIFVRTNQFFENLSINFNYIYNSFESVVSNNSIFNHTPNPAGNFKNQLKVSQPNHKLKFGPA